MKNNPNRLINEKSPYLLQHAYNPVDWYPWGEEAFQKAKAENKPIFLSIGYSTCHWCHVMEAESFEDEHIAKILNDRYVSVKVDREERPDIDSIYMKVCQQMSGHGGWPLNIFMTAEQIPFYAGTYFPKESRYGLPGFEEVILYLSNTFQKDPKQVEDVTKEVRVALKLLTERKSDKRLNKDVTNYAFSNLNKMYDSDNGGFGDAPKFPSPHYSMFLLRYYVLNGEKKALHMVENTLQSMAKGGIYDQIGFGFSRYSIDEQWLVPHFEKMLYDNALLLITYVEAFEVTKNPFYKKIAEEIIEFVKRELLSEEGGFYSAIDADSEGEEGKYYVWDKNEIIELVGEERANLFNTVYNITDEGNFSGKNIPHLIDINLEKEAENFHLTVDQLIKQLDDVRKELLEARYQRVYPHLDDKILTSWNSMMIVALAKAGRALNNESYLQMAMNTLQFIEKNCIKNGRLMARYRDKEVKFLGYIDDYAYLLWAYIEMYEASFELNYLEKGKQLAKEMISLFWDKQDGGFFFYGNDAEDLIVREKEVHDGAMPSGNSVATVMLARLFKYTGEVFYSEKVERLYHVFQGEIAKYPHGSTFFLQAPLLTEYPTKEIVIVGHNQREKKELQTTIHERFSPSTLVLMSENEKNLSKVAPFTESYGIINDQTTVYICENFSCQKPTNDLSKVIHEI